MPVSPSDPRLQAVGFAKLLGKGEPFEFVVRKYEVMFGRRSKTAVDIVIGEQATLSRCGRRVQSLFTSLPEWCSMRDKCWHPHHANDVNHFLTLREQF